MDGLDVGRGSCINKIFDVIAYEPSPPMDADAHLVEALIRHALLKGDGTETSSTFEVSTRLTAKAYRCFH